MTNNPLTLVVHTMVGTHPSFPEGVAPAYKALAEKCWTRDPEQCSEQDSGPLESVQNKIMGRSEQDSGPLESVQNKILVPSPVQFSEQYSGGLGLWIVFRTRFWAKPF